MSERRQWLRNDFNPAVVRANTFVVHESPVQLVATGLAATDEIVIEVRADATTTLVAGSDHYWAPLYRHGQRISLRGDNNQVVILLPGTYRIVGGPAVGSTTVALWEDEKVNGDRVLFNDIAGIISTAFVKPEAVPCAAAPVADMDTFQVTRFDVTTKAPVTLIYGAQKANNAVCPPVPAGEITLIGHIRSDGVYVPGPYPGMLGAGGCADATPLGELTTWG